MIQYQCPKCGETLDSPDSLAGKEDVCPNCGCRCIVPLHDAAGAQPASCPRRNPTLKYIIGGAVLVVLLAAGLAYFMLRDSDGGNDKKNAITARRAMAISMSQGFQMFRPDSDGHCALLLDIHEIISANDYREIPKDKIYVMFSGRRCDPAWSVGGVIVIASDKTKDMVKICFVVPKDVRTFTLHLGDRQPLEFTAPEKIEDEISEY